MRLADPAARTALARNLVRNAGWSAGSNDVRSIKAALLAFGALAALVSFGAVSEEDPFRRALSLAAQKRYAEAWEVLGPMLEREPGHARGRVLHGVLRAREGRVGEAIEIFERLQQEHPEMSEPYNNLAVLYALEGRLEAAREALLATLERQPDPIAYANLGDVYAKLARRAYERARELEGGGVGSGDLDTAFAMPVLRAESSEAVGAGVEPGARMPAKESGAAVTQPAEAVRETTEPPGDVAPESRKVMGAGQALAAPGAAAPPVSAGAGSATGSAFCARASGFAGRRAVADAALWLQSYGAEVLEVSHENRPTSGTWRVYLPPLATPKDAEARLREIRERGVRDVAVIRTGALENGISFGVYREEANVRRRVTALERLGYPVRSQAEGVERVEGYVIKTRVEAAAAAFKAAWTSRFPERPLRVVDCG